MTDHDDRIREARAIHVLDEVERRGHKLRRWGHEQEGLAVTVHTLTHFRSIIVDAAGRRAWSNAVWMD